MILVSFFFFLGWVWEPPRSFSTLFPQERGSIWTISTSRLDLWLPSSFHQRIAPTRHQGHGEKVGSSTAPQAPPLPGHHGSAVSPHQRPQLHTAALPRGSVTAHSLVPSGPDRQFALLLVVSLRSTHTLVNSPFIQFNCAISYRDCDK